MKQVYFVFFELNIFAIRDIIELLGLEVDIMSDMYCPKCKTLLNNDEKASGKCFNCGASFSSVLPEEKKNTQTSDAISNENTVGGILKAIGILILIIGTIGSIVIAGGDGYRYEFSFARFILPEIGTIVSGMMFLGFA